MNFLSNGFYVMMLILNCHSDKSMARVRKIFCSWWTLTGNFFRIPALVPDQVKKELLQRIRTFLAQQSNI